MSIVIRLEKIEDIDNVYEVVRKAFEQADHSAHDEHHLVNMEFKRHLKCLMTFLWRLSLKRTA